MLAILPSDPRYERLNALTQMRCWLLNPHMSRIEPDLPEIEQRMVLRMLDDDLWDELLGGDAEEWNT